MCDVTAVLYLPSRRSLVMSCLSHASCCIFICRTAFWTLRRIHGQSLDCMSMPFAHHRTLPITPFFIMPWDNLAYTLWYIRALLVMFAVSSRVHMSCTIFMLRLPFLPSGCPRRLPEVPLHALGGAVGVCGCLGRPRTAVTRPSESWGLLWPGNLGALWGSRGRRNGGHRGSITRVRGP